MWFLFEAKDKKSTGERSKVTLIDALTSDTDPCIIWVPRRDLDSMTESAKRVLGATEVGAFNYGSLVKGYIGRSQIENPNSSYILYGPKSNRNGKGKRLVEVPKVLSMRKHIKVLRDSYKTKHFFYKGSTHLMLKVFVNKGYKKKF